MLTKVIAVAISVFLLFAHTVLVVPMCQCSNQNASMDLATPRNAILTAFYKRSFAYYTVKVRMPVILTQTLDRLVREKNDIGRCFGPEGQEELKDIIGEISKLKYEVQTNKPLRHLTSDGADVKFYNDYLDKLSNEDGHTTYFHTIWLMAECYMYRRLREMFELSKHLKDFDPFRSQKIEAYNKSLPSILELGQHLATALNKPDLDVKKEFITLLKLNLWGNKLDLSLSMGQISSNSLFDVSKLDTDLLADDSEKIWLAVSDENAQSEIVDIIFDNSGYEVFSDLCVADFLITTKLASKIRLYVKSIPWFISDVMVADLKWTIEQLQNHSNNTLRILGQRWSDYLASGVWSVEEHNFWTLPVSFKTMDVVDAKLYRKLGQAKLAIFKGDLNYRKLFGEKNWGPTTDVETALEGFHPTKLCTLRTLKADMVCGLKEGVAEETEAKDQDWMISGKYGVIQFSEKVRAVD